MYLLNRFLPFLMLLAYIRCSVVPMPVCTVPERGRALEGIISGGSNGIGIHALYTTRNLVVLDVTAHTGLGLSISRAGELGIGHVIKNELGESRLLAVMNYGAGYFSRRPWHFSGEQGPVAAVNSRVQWTGIYLNRPFSVRSGGIARLTYYWGNSAQDRNYRPDLPNLSFTSYGLEVILYRLAGKNRNIISGIGLSYNTGRADGVRLKEFITPPLFLFMGYRFARKAAPATQH